MPLPSLLAIILILKTKALSKFIIPITIRKEDKKYAISICDLSKLENGKMNIQTILKSGKIIAGKINRTKVVLLTFCSNIECKYSSLISWSRIP